MRPPAAALANAGPRPHTLLVSHFVEVTPEYNETKHGQVSHRAACLCASALCNHEEDLL